MVKKSVIGVLIALLIAMVMGGCSGTAGSDPDGLMRGFKWDDSMDKVKSEEAGTPDEWGNILTYYDIDMGLPGTTMIGYRFTDEGNLSDIVYMIYTDESELISCFDELKARLAESYGEGEDVSSNVVEAGYYDEAYLWESTGTSISLYKNTPESQIDLHLKKN